MKAESLIDRQMKWGQEICLSEGPDHRKSSGDQADLSRDSLICSGAGWRDARFLAKGKAVLFFSWLVVIVRDAPIR
jgi:hypothetical protein